uniref:Glycoprotein hormone subunit beta 5 n=1 Tax=Oryzias sinensis TaxID=183150 RepID=A0A8C7X6C9_9TELE
MRQKKSSFSLSEQQLTAAAFRKPNLHRSRGSCHTNQNLVCSKKSKLFVYFCFFQKPVLEFPFIESYQRVCTYNKTRLVTVKLPKCRPHVDPTYTYPVALRCDCGVCLTSTTECIASV